MTDDTDDSEADIELDSKLRANEEFASGLRLGIASELGQTGFNDDENPRNHYDIFGWPRDVIDGWDEDNWLALYLRNAYARIVVEKPANTTWRDAPDITDPHAEGEEATDFERAVEKLHTNHRVWSYCERADRAAGIGQHGLLLLGFSDVVGGDGPRGNLDQWATDAREKDLSALSDIVQLKPVLGAQIEDIDYGDPDSERWDLPVEYTIDLGEDTDSETEDDSHGTIDCHWSRVIDIPATRPLDDETLARPRIEPVLNNILDIEKILGAAAEAGYRSADYGLHLNADPTEVNVDDGMSELQDELEAYEHDLQRYIRTAGVEVNRLGGDIQDPSGIVENNLDAIAGQTDIPKKEFRGNESGEVSGAEADERSYFGMVAERREQYATPHIARPLIDRLQAIGILPMPTAGEYRVEWPDLAELSAKDAADIESKRAQVISAVPGLAGDTAMRYLKEGADGLPEVDEDPLSANDGEFDPEAAQETFEDAVDLNANAGQRANAKPALDDPVDLPERIQNAGEAALEAAEEGLIPEECGTGVGTTRAEQGANNDVVVGDLLTRRNDMTPIPAYLNSHEEDLTADGPPTEWSDEEWADCGNVGVARWLYYVDWFKRKANELAEQRGEEPPYDDVSANATRYSENDPVQTPQGFGIVTEVRTENFEGKDGEVEASESSPTYVVGLKDGRVGVGFYKASELREAELPDTDVDDPVDGLADTSANSAVSKILDATPLRANDFTMPETWRESDTPARVILLKAWAGMNGQFDCGGDCCKGELMSGGMSERGANRVCASMKDEVLGGWEGWRK